MLRAYEFKLQPTPSQERRLVGCLDACRWTYNWALDDRQVMYRYGKYSTGFYDQSKYLVELKKEHPSLRGILGKRHLKVERCRKDFHRKVACSLVAQFNPIFIEGLDIRGLVQKSVEDKKQNKKFRARPESILDAAWGEFSQRLGSKAENAGSATMAVEPRGTSQECSGCCAIVRKNLGERVHACPWCGLVLDRDENAARNILARGLEKLRGEDKTGWAALSARGQVVELAPMTREASPL